MKRKENKTRIRVVMAGPAPPAVGGMATAIADLCSSNLSEQVDLEVFDTGKTTPLNRPFWVGVSTRITLMKLWWKKLSFRRDMTIAHIHTCSGLTFFLDSLLLLLASIRRVPVVLHIHGGRFSEFLDGLSYFSMLGARIIFRLADVNIVLSEEWKEAFQKRLPHAKFAVIPNGVKVPDKHIERVVAPNNRVTIMFLGSLCEAKGILDLLEVMRRLKGRARLVLVGKSVDADFENVISIMLNGYCLAEDVVLAGPCFGSKKDEWFSSADIFVLPSYVEALPISVLEAMAFSLPVVSTTVGAIPSVIRNGIDGILLDPGDIDLLAESLEKLISNESLRKRMGVSAYFRCKSEYNLEHISNTYVDMYVMLNDNRYV